MRKGLLLILLFTFPGVSYAVPSYDEVRRSYVGSDSVLLDRHGEVIQELRTNHRIRRLGWTPLEAVSPALVEAVVQAEDRRFYEHHGVDYKALIGALYKGFRGKGLRGASTISMQLVSLLDERLRPRNGRRSVRQKLRQMKAARDMEKTWTKKQILEAYLNLTSFRGELQGIRSASLGLFRKEPHGLTAPEALILASLIRSPNAGYKNVQARAAGLAGALGWSVESADLDATVKGATGAANPAFARMALAPHAARRLFRGNDSGEAVRSTLDGRTQRLAVELMSHQLALLRAQNVNEGAILVVENKTGEVLAYVSMNSEGGSHVDGVMAKRQAGSALKPFLYGLAFGERLLTPGSLIHDAPLDTPVHGGIYSPQNYDNKFRGLVSARTALGSSLNIPAVKTLSLVGTEAYLRKLRSLGIQGLDESGDFYGPSLSLGTADVSLWELVAAYRTLPRGGIYGELSLRMGEGTGGEQIRVFSEEAAFLVCHILSDREARSGTFGLENPLSTRFWSAVKTGTSKDMRDNWCIGFTKDFTVGVWVGNFSGSPMWDVSGIMGAAPIWVEIMNFLHADLPSTPPDPPAGLVMTRIRFPVEAEPSREEWFIRGTEPEGPVLVLAPSDYGITYPPSGTVIALDQDIPPGRQKVIFTCRSWAPHLGWALNGSRLAAKGPAVPWAPKAGKFTLAVVDKSGGALDSVSFEVRGHADRR